MAWCLIPEKVTQFKKALLSREVDPEHLAKMDSVTRRKFLERYVGSENAKQVNALFESKLLLKNQKAGYISWAKRTAGLSSQAKRDVISKIERMEKVLNPTEEKMFLEDLAAQKLGFGITSEEAKQIFDLSQAGKQLEAKANTQGIFPSNNDRLSYGWNRVQLEDFVNEAKLKFGDKRLRTLPIRAVGNIPGILKSTVASFDNSFFGRQGIKTLLDIRTSHIWVKDFLKSWNSIGKSLLGKDAMAGVKADIYSRPNALNGKYKAGNYGLDVLSEEAFPSHALGKIPLLGRLYKASESAYNGGALTMRADLADRLIARAEKAGVNTLNRAEAEGLGHLVGSLTGRGSTGLTASQASKVNVLLFSPKFLKANFDTLTAHVFDKKVTGFAQKEAAKNLVSMIFTLSSVLGAAKMLNPDSVDLDQRSTNFGKVKVFGHWTDITGGMGSLVTLASRLTPSYHNGQLGFWSKSSSGAYQNLISGEYGKQNALDVFQNFWEGKLSPAAGIVRDLWKGEMFGGEPISLGGLAKKQLPLILQNYEQFVKDPASSNILGTMILEGLGFSVASYNPTQKNWANKPTQKQQQFREVMGEEKFKQANDDFNKQYNDWYEKTVKTEEFKSLTDEARGDLIQNGRDKVQENVFKKYGFTYKQNKKSSTQKAIEKNLLP